MPIHPREPFGVRRIVEIEVDGDALLIERQPRGHGLEQIVAALAGVAEIKPADGSASQRGGARRRGSWSTLL